MSASKSNASMLKMDAIGLALLIGLSIGGYMLILQPMLTVHQQREAQQAELAARHEKANQALATINTLKRDLINLRQAAGENPLQLVPAQYSNQRLADITHLAAEHQLQVDMLQTGATKPGARFEVVPIQLRGSGSFQTCTAFVNHLHRRFPDTAVWSMGLTDNPSDAASPTNFTLELAWFAAPALSSASK